MFPDWNKNGRAEDAKMAKRNRNKQTETLAERLQYFAQQAREAARKLPEGTDRDDLLRKAEMAEDARRSEWVAPPGTQRPAEQ